MDEASALYTEGYDVEVWVAQGRYDEFRFEPTIGGHGQNLGSLVLLSPISVYGGFRGDEVDREQRDWLAYETTIDGSTSRGGPALHVILCMADARLDGFTITGGHANIPFSDEEYGGGMLNLGCAPVIANCTFLRNRAYYGGGGMSSALRGGFETVKILLKK